MIAQPGRPIKIFFCSTHEDRALQERLVRHLTILRRLRDITGWFEFDVQAGSAWRCKIRLSSGSYALFLIRRRRSMKNPQTQEFKTCPSIG